MPSHLRIPSRRIESWKLRISRVASGRDVGGDGIPAADDDEPVHEVVGEGVGILDRRSLASDFEPPQPAARRGEDRERDRRNEPSGQAAAVCSCFR